MLDNEFAGFAGDGEGDDPGDESGDDDDDPGDDDDDSDDDDQEENEKKFSQKDVDDAVKKRLAREKKMAERSAEEGWKETGTARLKPERIATRMTMSKHRNSVIKLPKQMRWR